MRIDVVHLVGRDAGALEGELDARGHTRAVGARVRHVIRVAVGAAAEQLCVDARPPRLRVLQAL